MNDKIWDLKQFGDNLAIVADSSKRITYSELSELSQHMQVPSERKEVVFILCRNCVTCVAFYISCVNDGTVPLMLDAKISNKQLQILIDDYKPMYCYVPKERRESISGYICIRVDDGYCLLQIRERISYEIYEDLALLLPTSGSTGSRKVVRQSYNNIKSNARAICCYLSITDLDRSALNMPLYYTYGLSILHSYLMVGATILITDKSVLQKEFWTFVRDNGMTSFSGVPYTYELLRRIKFEEIDLPNVRYMTQAGGAMDGELWEYMRRYTKQRGIMFYVMYGQTESTARISYLPCEDFFEKQGSVGVAVPGTKIYIEQGEVVCEGDSVCLGYAMNYRDLNNKDDWNGVLHTGDYGCIDSEGYLYIYGRKDRYVKLLGKRINLDELQVLLSEQLGEKIYMVKDRGRLKLVSKKSISRDAIWKFAKSLGVPSDCICTYQIENIPRTATGKVDYEKL